jgi:citrate lyase alpha subunit
MGEVTGNNGGHYDSADSAFITTYIAPWVKATQWPASNLAVSKR